LLNNHAAVIFLLKEDHIKIKGNITLEEAVEKLITTYDKGFWLPIASEILELKDTTVSVLAD
jgi:hypothetical protein